jgi:hypothetical protein
MKDQCSSHLKAEVSGRVRLGLLGAMLALSLLMGCSHQATTLTAPAQPLSLQGQWGVEPVAIRLAAADHFLDFRFKIIDPDKAALLMQRNTLAYVIDEASGKVLPVPITKLGPLRANAIKPKAEKHYTILFSNSGKYVKPGSRVTVVIGAFKAEHLIVT